MRNLFFLFVLFSINSAFSQNKYKIEIGTSLSAFSNENVSPNLGISFDVLKQWQLSKNINLASGIIYSIKRGEIDISSVGYPDGAIIKKLTLNTETHYVEIPLLVGYNFFNTSSLKSDIYSGLSFNLAVWDNSKTSDERILYSLEDYNPNEWGNIKYDYYWQVETAPHFLSSSGFGFYFGIGFEMNMFTLDVRIFRDLHGLETADNINVKMKKINSISLLLGFYY